MVGLLVVLFVPFMMFRRCQAVLHGESSKRLARPNTKDKAHLQSTQTTVN